MNEPILSKRENHRFHYRPMTWIMFINLRKWAKQVADSTGYKVYLVGSTLEKEIPRDIDVSVVIPFEEYERLYGKWSNNPSIYNQVMLNASNDNFKHYWEGLDALDKDNKVVFDLKFCPDTWWIDKDKLLLAEPKYLL